MAEIEAPAVETDRNVLGPEGTVIETPADQPNEVIVYDYDEAGNLVGSHKEVVNG